MTDNEKPVAKVGYYPVTASIWKKANGKGEAFYSVTFERSYKDEKGKYKYSSSFSGTDLLLLAKVADLAHTEIDKWRQGDWEALQEEKKE
jgi:hypothetical protein